MILKTLQDSVEGYKIYELSDDRKIMVFYDPKSDEVKSTELEKRAAWKILKNSQEGKHKDQLFISSPGQKALWVSKLQWTHISEDDLAKVKESHRKEHVEIQSMKSDKAGKNEEAKKKQEEDEAKKKQEEEEAKKKQEDERARKESEANNKREEERAAAEEKKKQEDERAAKEAEAKKQEDERVLKEKEEAWKKQIQQKMEAQMREEIEAKVRAEMLQGLSSASPGVEPEKSSGEPEISSGEPEKSPPEKSEAEAVKGDEKHDSMEEEPKDEKKMETAPEEEGATSSHSKEPTKTKSADLSTAERIALNKELAKKKRELKQDAPDSEAVQKKAKVPIPP